MVMVVEGGGGGGVQGGELGHGILRTFMRDESGGRNKNHTNQDYNWTGWGLRVNAKEKLNLKWF